MGHYADKYAGRTSEEPQKFFLNTGDAKSFARKLVACRGQEGVRLVRREGLLLTRKTCEHVLITSEKGLFTLSVRGLPP